MDTNHLLINFMLYVLLPLWGIAGCVDWFCHRATRIEATSGIKETLLHSVMGVQIAVPILLCLLFRVNVMILLICIVVWLAHEWVAHWDVRIASPKRTISIWEMHAHSYLSTLPLYMLIIIAVVNWPVVMQLVTLEWAGQFSFAPVTIPHGGSSYMPLYLSFMAVVCVFPYMEENIRCLRYWQQTNKRQQQ